MRTRIAAAAAALMGLLLLILLAGAWVGSGQFIVPPWQVKGIAHCAEDWRKDWGPDCGNLAVNRKYIHADVTFPTPRGYELPGWYVARSATGGPDAARPQAAETAAIFMHGGGADRREGYRYIDYFLGRGFDVYLFDFSCHGDAPCVGSGLSFGEREHKDFLDVLRFVRSRHRRVFAMGTSVGATSILLSLPSGEPIDGVIAENPMYSYERFVLETPAAPSLTPGWFRRLLFGLSSHRGEFSASLSAAEALRRAPPVTPILFIHSRADGLIPYTHSVDLYDVYRGPKQLVLFDTGSHAYVWNAHEAEYRRALDAFVN